LLCLLSLLLPRMVTAQPGQAAAACPPGLVHYFGLDETTAASAYLDYQSPVKAKCAACPEPVQGLFAGAQKFDGKDDGLDITDIQHFQWGPNSNFTIELWVKTTGSSSSNQVLIGREAEDSQMLWWIGLDTNGYAVFEMWDRQRNGFLLLGDKGGKINDGQWHHIAVVRDGRVRRNKLYVDGFAAGNFEYDYKDNLESSSPVNIGYLNLDHGYHFAGLLDEVMVYNRALEETEMRDRYNQGAGNYCGPEQVKPMIVSEAITFGVVGQQYQYDVNATGTPAPTYTLVAGPQGMQLNGNTGMLLWTPIREGSFEVKVKAANGVGEDLQTFNIQVKKSIGEEAGLLHHWMLHEIGGTRYKDYYTPYEATCAEGSCPKPTNGAVSGGQQFDGKDDGLDVAQTPNFDWTADASFSIELWMRTTASTAGNRVLIGRQAKDSPVHWWLGVDDKGKAGFQMLDLNWQGIYVGNSGPVLNDGKWHQLVAVRDGKGISRLYVDGVQVAEGRHVFTAGFASSWPVTIAYMHSGNGYHYEGDLDEVKLFGRVLSAEEIKSRYDKVYDAITELVHFTGKYNAGSVYLDWATAAEVECKDFVVERSADGESFEAIATVAATGNSNVKVDYKHIDQAPLPDVSYYRLRINKTNGTFTYSNIIRIEVTGLSASSFMLYPNPTVGGEQVEMEITRLPADALLQFFVSDLTGRVVLRQEVSVGPDGVLRLQLPISERFRPGIYNLSVVTDKRTLSRKLVIVQ